MKIVFLWIVIFLLLPFSTYAYGTDTHAYLTSVILDTYSKKHPGSFKDEWRNFTIDGSRREDDDPRYFNHFYDPINNTGLKISLGTWNSAKNWAQNEEAQGGTGYKTTALISSILTSIEQRKLSLLSTETDFAWQRAVRAYVRGDKEKALFILGHVLHLLEDMGVPDHTRNDPHADGSPYEKWAARFSADNPDSNLKNFSLGLLQLSSLGEYFNNIAEYSNKNFYSKDTIGLINYSQPYPEGFKLCGTGYCAIGLENNKEYALYFKTSLNSSVIFENKNNITINDENVLRDYWAHLAPKVVQNGVGVMDLFFGEVEKAKSDPNFVSADSKSWFATALDTTGKLIFSAKNLIQNIFPTGERNEIVDVGAPVQIQSSTTTVQNSSYQAPSEPKVAGTSTTFSDETTHFDANLSNQITISNENTLTASSDRESKNQKSAVDNNQISPTIAFVNVGGGGTPTSIISNSGNAPGIAREGNADSGISGEELPLNSEEVSSTSTSTSTVSEATSSATSTKTLNPLVLGRIMAFYVASTSRGEFSWEAAELVDGSTSSISYDLEWIEGGEKVAFFTSSTALRASSRLYERDRDYNFLFTGHDDKGHIATTTFSIHAPGILSENEVYFYRDNRINSNNRYLIDLRPKIFPFIPPEVLGGSDKVEQGMLFYLNRDPDELNNVLGQESSNGILVTYPTGKTAWTMVRDPLHPPEDMRFVIEAGPDASSTNFSSSDYITLAYYTYDAENNGPLRIAGYSKKKFHFSETPPEQSPPSMPPEFKIGSGPNGSSYYIDFSWQKSTDPDSPDNSLIYEWSIGLSSDSQIWNDYGGGIAPEGAYKYFSFSEPGEYIVAVRAKDEFGATSLPAMGTVRVGN